jgi:hypothetical protein
MTVVGDLGCPGVDVDRWRTENRVPLFRGKVNRWILARTLRDDPSPDDIKQTLATTFMKWFAGTSLDPALVFHGTTRSATADLIKLERISKERLSFPKTARRREDLPGVVPVLRSGDFVWLEVSFAYRGQEPNHFAEEPLVHLAEDVGRQNGELVGACRVVDASQDIAQDLVVELEIRRQLVMGLGAVFRAREMKEPGVVAFVGAVEPLH